MARCAVVATWTGVGRTGGKSRHPQPVIFFSIRDPKSPTPPNSDPKSPFRPPKLRRNLQTTPQKVKLSRLSLYSTNICPSLFLFRPATGPCLATPCDSRSDQITRQAKPIGVHEFAHEQNFLNKNWVGKIPSHPTPRGGQKKKFTRLKNKLTPRTHP